MGFSLRSGLFIAALSALLVIIFAVVKKKLNIKYNGVPENRRGKKIYPGDIVEIQNKKYEITK